MGLGIALVVILLIIILIVLCELWYEIKDLKDEVKKLKSRCSSVG